MELQVIQQEFMRHFGVTLASELVVPDGDYLVPVYEEYFNVRVVNNGIRLIPDDQFDTEKATRI